MNKQPRARASQTCTKGEGTSIRARTGSMCRKTMNGGILLPQLSQHAGGLRRALLRSHSPMVCAACWRLPGVVALRCWHSASAKLVHGNGGLLWRKTLRQGAELGHLVRLVCRVCCCMARGALLFRPLQMARFSHTQLFGDGQRS